METAQTPQTEKNILFKRLNIPIERGAFIMDKCLEIYWNEIKLKKYDPNAKIKDVIDIIEQMRNEHSQNASEDILICYTVGAIMGKQMSDNFMSDTIRKLFDIWK